MGATKKSEGSPSSFCSHQVSHQSLTWGETLKSEKVIFSLLEKLWTKKYPSNKFNHLSTAYASIYPSNMGISKLICTLKGVVSPEWLPDEDASSVGIRRRIWAKLSIIAFLCRSRASSRNILKGYPALSSLFSSTIGGRRGLWGWSCKGSTSSSPNYLYPDLIGDKQIKIEKEQTALIPLIQNYAEMQQNTHININTEMKQE